MEDAVDAGSGLRERLAVGDVALDDADRPGLGGLLEVLAADDLVEDDDLAPHRAPTSSSTTCEPTNPEPPVTRKREPSIGTAGMSRENTYTNRRCSS